MKVVVENCKYYFWLIGIALLWLVFFGFVSQMDQQGIIYPDSASYLESAKNLYIFYRGHNYRPVLMALINGIPYLFGFGDAAIYEFGFYVNVVCWMASSLLLFELGKQFLKPRTAFVFTLVFFATVANLAYIFHLLTENIYLFFMLSGFYALSVYYQNKRFIWLSVGLSIFMLAMLVRPGSMYFAVLIALFFVREIVANWRNKAAILFYGSIACIMVQCAGLKYQFGNFTVSYIDAVTYYGYLGSRSEALANGVEYIEVNNPRGVAFYKLPMPDQKTVAAADFKKQLTMNTDSFFKAYAINLLDNTKSGNTPLLYCKKVLNHAFLAPELFWISKWQNRILTIAGLVLSVYFFFTHYRKQPLYFLMSAFVLYIILLSGISSTQGDRFHMVTYPFTILLFAKFLVERNVLDKIKHRIPRYTVR